ncbi:4074_t:CDS:1 [Funneliformis caledonium]|uniref:4074_t:CDS:1 n=1 Tax=Funneliformis caledonium TaxID=1117310 RepID=A0A9N9GJH5_9GLOM|nr:4074_t:CDS:1 [Funneliformis caledonium]
MNVRDITPQNVSSENEIPLKTNPLYKLIETQANRFEEFGNQMKLQLHTLYQEYTKQRDETLKNNLIEFEKIGKMYQKQIESQSELIDQLIVRIENLEISSNKKDQDVGNLKEDFNNFLKSKKEIKDVGLKDDVLEPSKSSHEESTNNFSSCFTNNYNLSSPSSLKINSFDQENQETVSKLERIHTQLQQLVTQKETFGFKIRLKHIKSFVRKNSFTSADLIQYTKASNFNLLNDETKILINRLIKEMSSNENNTRELKQHHAQMITEEIEGSNLENNLENENLKPSKTTDDESAYYLSSCFSDNDNLSSSSSLKINSFDQESQETVSKLERIHTQLQQLVTQKENLGLKIRLKHIKSFVNENSITSADLIQYMKKSNFNLLNDETKRSIYLLVEEMLSEYEDIITNEGNTTNENNASKLEQLHAQIIIKSKIRGKSIKRKDLTFLCRPSKFNILIPYTKTLYFDSLSKKIKYFLNIIINDELQKELIPLELKLSQNLEEYIKRDLIPPLPAGYDSYAEYKNSDIFRSLSISQRWKVSKLVKFQEEKIKIDEQIKEDLAKDVLILDGKEFKFIS